MTKHPIDQIISDLMKGYSTTYTFHRITGKILDQIQELIDRQKDCHQSVICTDSCVELSGVYITDPNHNVVSYITFTREQSDLTGEEFVLINFSCTRIDHRRKGLSRIIRLIIMVYALHHNIRYVASDVNEQSGQMAKKYFNFTLGNEYIPLFNYEATSYIDLKDPKHQKYIDKMLTDPLSTIPSKK